MPTPSRYRGCHVAIRVHLYQREPSRRSLRVGRWPPGERTSGCQCHLTSDLSTSRDTGAPAASTRCPQRTSSEASHWRKPHSIARPEAPFTGGPVQPDCARNRRSLGSEPSRLRRLLPATAHSGHPPPMAGIRLLGRSRAGRTCCPSNGTRLRERRPVLSRGASGRRASPAGDTPSSRPHFMWRD